MDHPVLTDHGVFYPRGLRRQIKLELTLAPVSDVLVYSDTVKTPSYSLTDIELEYTCVTNEALADRVRVAVPNWQGVPVRERSFA